MSKLKHFKEFETYSEYETYINGKPMLPNVSFVGQSVYYKDGEPHPEDYFNFGVDSSEVESTDTSIINTYDTNYPSITFEYNGIVTGITDNNGNITANFNENTIEQQQTGSVIAKYNDTIVGTWTITQKAYEKPDYSKQYLTFKITGAGNINVPTGTTYSINGGEWENTGTTLAVNGGESIRFKGNNTTYSGNTFSASTAVFELEGNIMSLLYGDDFYKYNSLPSIRTLLALFYRCIGLTTAENLILPATILRNSCYNSMFQGCTSLVTAPELPATTLASGCYNSMFYNCTSLNYIKCLATSNIGTSYTTSWLNGVASSGTFVKAAGVTWPKGTDGIPSGWIVQEV